MKILIIANEYYPNPSAITNVFANMVNEMKKVGHEVNVLTKKQNINMSNEEIIGDVKVYRIQDWFYNSYDITNNIKSYKANGLMKIAKYLSLVIYKISRFISYWYDYKILKNQDGYINKKDAIKTGVRLNNANKYDIIISLSYPFVMHEIAHEIVRYSKVKSKWYAYQFDPNAKNNTLKENLYNKRLKKEIKILKDCNGIFLPKENYEENLKTRLNILKDKYIVFPYANIAKPKYEGKVQTDDVIKFIYAGTLYKDIREPQKMLDFFINIMDKKQLKFKIVMCYKSVPEMAKVIDNYKQILGENIEVFEDISKEQCDIISSNANIILNIGNSTANQIPSKIFENISLGKPILNFYSIDNDTSKKQLEKYPAKMNVNMKEEYSDDIYQNFIKFVNENKYIQMSFEEATKNYDTSQKVAKMFMNIVMGE